MSLKNWILLMFGFALIHPQSSAKFCMRRYVNGKWVTKGDCGGPEKMSAMRKELRLPEYKKRLADGKWVVFQRRVNGDVDFFRGWNDYEKGFGNKDGDFWLGLAALHEMTKGKNMEMAIQMIKRTGVNWVAKYRNFWIGPASDKYKLHVSGFSGNATRDGTGDGFSRSNNLQFSTHDADHDVSSDNCASRLEGGWWYYWYCGVINLNGNFNKTDEKGIWYWGASSSYLLRFTEMKIRKRL